MSKKVKNTKRAMITTVDNINYNDIRKQLNSFDKEFNIKLKKHDKNISADDYIEIVAENCNIELLGFVVILNGLNIDDYFEETGYGFNLLKPVGTDNPSFCEESKLHWNNDFIYSTDSLIFRYRFASNVCQYMFGNFSKIIANSVADKKHSYAEYGIINCKKYINYILKFILLVIDPHESYDNIILKIHEITSYKYNKVKHNKLKRTLNYMILSLKENMTSNILVDRFYSDDLAISSILELAYILGTNDYNYDCLPNFKYIEDATVEDDLVNLIKRLGELIIKHNGKKKYPLMFRAFINANPVINSQYKEESINSEKIRTGIAALNYASFIVDDKTIKKFIKGMLKKGKY